MLRRPRETCQGERVVVLAGEGGGLDLYEFSGPAGPTFSWQPVWQILDEDGNEPERNPNAAHARYSSIAEAMASAPSYWHLLAPVHIDSRYYELLHGLLLARLDLAKIDQNQRKNILFRWERLARRLPGTAA